MVCSRLPTPPVPETHHVMCVGGLGGFLRNAFLKRFPNSGCSTPRVKKCSGPFFISRPQKRLALPVVNHRKGDSLKRGTNLNSTLNSALDLGRPSLPYLFFHFYDWRSKPSKQRLSSSKDYSLRSSRSHTSFHPYHLPIVAAAGPLSNAANIAIISPTNGTHYFQQRPNRLKTP